MCTAGLGFLKHCQEQLPFLRKSDGARPPLCAYWNAVSIYLIIVWASVRVASSLVFSLVTVQMSVAFLSRGQTLTTPTTELIQSAGDISCNSYQKSVLTHCAFVDLDGSPVKLQLVLEEMDYIII